MSEIIEFACDICGQKYRYSEERMGRKTDCRECGAPFELNKHTIAKDEDEDGSDDEETSPWLLIRSAFVGTLLFFIIGGLSYLPFSSPDPQNLMAATPPSGQLNNFPPGFPQSNFPGQGFPNGNPGFNPSGQPNAGMPNAGMPGNNTVWPPPKTKRKVRPGVNNAGDVGNPQPGEGATQNADLGAASQPKDVPDPADGPMADQGKPEKPLEPKPEKGMAAGGAESDDDPGEVPADFKKAPFVSSVSIGKLDGRDDHIVVKGANLSKVKTLIPIYDPFWPLSEEGFSIVSNTRIDTGHVVFAGGYKPVGVLLGSAEGATLAIPANAMRVSKEETIERNDKVAVVVVEKGGTLTTDARALIVVEQGGTLNVKSPFGAYVALKGGTVRSDTPLHRMYLATGAKYEPRIRSGFAPERIPTIRVIRLKSNAPNE